MTCFSIQKSFIFGLFLMVATMTAGLSAHAQDMRNADGSRMTAEQKADAARVDAPILIELFTASDCSACILADRLLYEAMKDKKVIALSCHVKDLTESLVDGKAEERGDDAGKATDGPMDPCVFRQWAYKTQGGTKDISINIPEFVINGQVKMGIDNLPLFYRNLDAYHFSPRNSSLEILGQWKDKDTILINLPESVNKGPLQPKSSSVWIIRYKDMAVEKINAGVNAGKVLRFSNIIQDIRHVGKWHGNIRTMEIDVPKLTGGKDRGGYAFVVQEVMGGPVLASGVLEDYPLPNDLKRSAEPQANKALVIERQQAPKQQPKQ